MTIKNMWDWMELFDNGVEDEIELELDAENLDVFFPDWDTYIDEDNPFGSLKMEDINAIKTLHILIADDVQEVEDLEGEGTYDVVSCNCELADQAIKDEGGLPRRRDRTCEEAGRADRALSRRQLRLRLPLGGRHRG